MANRDSDHHKDSEDISSMDDEMVRGRADEMDDTVEDTDELDETEDMDEDEVEGDGTF